MNAPTKLKQAILLDAKEGYDHLDFSQYNLEDPGGIEECWEKFNWDIQDCKEEFRGGSDKTNIPTPYSRYYESKSVATKMSDGSWVGWTYWYGGGKHGQPEAVEWVDDAYYLDCKEEEKVVTVRTFTKQ